MLWHPGDHDLFLFEVADLDGPHPDQWSAGPVAALPAATRILAWAREYLSQGHPQLGRPGSVCPYVPTSLRDSRFYVTARQGHPSVEQVTAVMLGYRDWFTALEPSGDAAPLTTILVGFPDVATEDAPGLIDVAQRELKPGFVRAGLMVGQFHPTPPDEPGLWNPDFRPLLSPMPLLAIRRMVVQDVAFLLSAREFVVAYLDRFGRGRVPQRYQDRLDEVLGYGSEAVS